MLWLDARSVHWASALGGRAPFRSGAIVLLVALSSCNGPGSPPSQGTSSHGSSSSVASGVGGAGGWAAGVGGAGGADSAGGGPGSGGGGGAAPCPADMEFSGVFCMDRFEAPNQMGAAPLVMQSALSAEAWCGDRGKRLCTEDEWDIACAGSQGFKYPYGNVHEQGRCNDDKAWKTVDEGALATWPSEEAQAEVDKLWQGEPSGNRPGCVSAYGIFDLTGNIEEWVVRTKPHANNYPHVLKGCYWAGCYGGSKPSCSSTNPAHASAFRFYETGFRCCRDAQ